MNEVKKTVLAILIAVAILVGAVLAMIMFGECWTQSVANSKIKKAKTEQKLAEKKQREALEAERRAAVEAEQVQVEQEIVAKRNAQINAFASAVKSQRIRAELSDRTFLIGESHRGWKLDIDLDEPGQKLYVIVDLMNDSPYPVTYATVQITAIGKYKETLFQTAVETDVREKEGYTLNQYDRYSIVVHIGRITEDCAKKIRSVDVSFVSVR